MATALLPPHGNTDQKDALPLWQQRIRELANDVRIWSEAEGWHVGEEAIILTEHQVGSYSVPRLKIDLPVYGLYLQPVGRFVMGAQGRVDLYGYPSMDRVMLLYKGDQWVVVPELGPTWPLPWNAGTFVDLAERLTTGP